MEEGPTRRKRDSTEGNAIAISNEGDPRNAIYQEERGTRPVRRGTQPPPEHDRDAKAGARVNMLSRGAQKP